MRIKEYLAEAKPDTDGRERLVSSILNMMKGRKPSRNSIKAYLKALEKDDSFIKRIKRRAAQLGKPGYIWNAIRFRSLGHFKKFTL